MKIGITIPDYYERFLKEIASLNGSNKTSICSLIVENFLSFNLKQKKYPLFRKNVSIVFANEVPKSSSNDSGSSSHTNNVQQDSEQPSASREEVLANLEKETLRRVPEDPEDSGLPFEYESED